MINSITSTHQQRFEEIRKGLRALGCRESQFIKVELLFFEVLAISRTYGDDITQNTLLAALKNVQHDQYEKTKIITKKAGQREVSIRRFVVSLRKILSGSN
jgi:ABC-type transport system involved in cytochrome c biogenesis ATPase subunit